MSRHVALSVLTLVLAAVLPPAVAVPATSPKDPKLQMVAKGLFHTGTFKIYTPKGRWPAIKVYAKREPRHLTNDQVERLAARYTPRGAVLTIGGHRVKLDVHSSQLPRRFSWLLGSFRAVTDEEAKGPATVEYHDSVGRHTLTVMFPAPQ